MRALLELLPAAVILLPLIFGLRPGERTLVRLAERRSRQRPRRVVLATFAARTPPALPHISGGRLIARSLAGRAPPVAVT
jgi:hypothetical protein